MIINSLNIYGFGKLSDLTIELQSGINIIEGKNEAGKSTIMAFIRAILFGFENKKKLHERYEPIHGGKFGGAIFLSDNDNDGGIYQIERVYHKKASGDVSITKPNGDVVGEEYLSTLLGKINDNIFKQIFCFGLSELQQINLLKDDQINDFIYHAGTGSVNQILRMKKELNQKKANLFLASGTVPSINVLISKLNEITVSINKLKEKNSNYNIYLEQIKELEQEIKNYEEKSEIIKNELNRLKILERTYEPYIQKKRAEIALSEYPTDFDFPENGVERVNGILTNIDKLKLEYNQLVERLETINGELIELPDVDFYLDNKELILNTKDQLNTYYQQLKSEQSLINDLQKNSDNIVENLRQIGSDYTEEKIKAIEITIQDKQYIQEQGNLIDKKYKSLEDLNKEIEMNKKNSYIVKNKLEGNDKGESGEKNNDKLKDIIPLIKKYWESLRENELQRKIKSEQKEDYQQQLKSMGSKIPLLNLIMINGPAIIGAIILVLLLENFLYGGLLLVASLIFSLLFISYNNKTNITYQKSINNNIKNLLSQIDRIDSEIIIIKDKSNSLLTTLGFNDLIELNEATILKLEELDRANLEESVYQHSERKRIKEYQKELKDNQLEFNLLQEKKDTLLQEINDQNGAFDTWLLKQSLPTNISINILNNLIVIIERLKELYITRDSLLLNIKGANKYREEFETKVNNLLAAINISLDTTIEGKVNFLTEQLKKVETGIMTNSMNNKNIEDINQRINKNKKENEQENLKYQELLKYANVTDKEDFYKLDERFKEYTILIKEQKQHSITIQNNCRNEYNYEQILDELEDINIDDLNSRIEQSNEELKEISESIKAKSVDKGETQNQVSELENDSELSEQNQKYEIYTNELKDKVKAWTSLTLSENILDNTMKIYEDEKQPQLIQSTSEFFSEMTGNNYIKVLSSMENNEISVIRSDQVKFEPQFLSRGTVEQLFLAVRYALVEEYSNQNRLPIILDDIFVNFDSERFTNAIKTLEKLSNKHQIIIFTCHTYASEKIQEAIKELKHTNLS